MEYYLILKSLGLSEERGFGLDLSFVTVEQVPLLLSDPEPIALNRIHTH